MPRVHILRKKYMITDLQEWIVSNMRVQKKSQSYMGDLLGMSQQAYGYRLREGKFEFGHLIEIFKELKASDEEILRLMKK